MDFLRVCLLHILPQKGKMEENMDRLFNYLDKIEDPDIDVYMTPEGYLDGYISTESFVTDSSIAEYGIDERRSCYMERIASFSKERKAWFIFGCIVNSLEVSRNAAVIINRKGEFAGRYDKVHCQAHDRKYSAGSELPVFEADFGTFGVMICADRRWPETVRTLALRGARVIFNPSFGMKGGKNETILQTRSYESEVYICFCHPREALVTNPNGDTEARMFSNVDGYLIHDLRLSMVDECRKSESSEKGHLLGLRAEAYHKL